MDLVSDVGTLGTQLVASTLIGLATGYYLDKWLGTKPWLLVLMLILGIIAGFKNVFREVQKLQEAEEKKTHGKYGDSGKD